MTTLTDIITRHRNRLIVAIANVQNLHEHNQLSLRGYELWDKWLAELAECEKDLRDLAE